MKVVKNIKKLLLASLVLLFSSCISYKDSISFNDNFSGDVKIELTVSSILARQLDREFDLDKLSRQLNKEKYGIILKGFNRVQTGKLVSYIFKIHFRSIKDLNNFSLDYFDIESPQDIVSNSKLFNISLEENDGKIYWSRILKISQYKNKGDIPEFLSVLLSNYIWEYKAKFPYQVIRTNGLVSEDRKSVTWKFDLYTLTITDNIKLEAVLKKPSFWNRILRFIPFK